MSKKIVLAGAVRTAIGQDGRRFGKRSGCHAWLHRDQRSSQETNVAPDQVDEVLMGCVLQAAQGQNVARQAAVNAGIPIEVPALTLNNVCGSGLKCVNMAAAMIEAGEADIVVAGGMENMSSAPVCADQSSLWLSHEQCYHDRYYGQRCTLGCIQRLPHGHHR